jgi:hypothetical protein
MMGGSATTDMPFSDFSVDVLPLILCQLAEPCQLANACLVSKTFYTYAAPPLYERVCTCDISLFRTLAHNPTLALHIRFLGPFYSSLLRIMS